MKHDEVSKIKNEKVAMFAYKNKAYQNTQIKKIYEHYGAENQIQKAIEELGELIEAIKEKDKIHIAEEIADVEIMLKQLKIIYDIQQGEVEEIKLYKIDRQNKRMLEKNEKKA